MLGEGTNLAQGGTMTRRRLPQNPMILAAGALLALSGPAASADLTPQWLRRVPTGPSWYSGLSGIVVDAGGTTYVAGQTGDSNNSDILVAAFDAEGTPLWLRTWDGPAGWHDQARGIALGPGNAVYVTGNTPGPGSYANVIVLAFDGATGNLVRQIQYSSGAQTAEHGASIAVDSGSRVYVAGGTVGDGSDVHVIAFDQEGSVAWRRTWDGAAWGPYSQDGAVEVLLDPSGNPVVLITGYTASSHPDYVVVKYDAGTGATLWEGSWGVNGGDFPADMAIDAAGDVYVTGTGIDFIDKYSTVKFSGASGAVLWQRYDALWNDHSARAIALDGQGGVYVTGSADPEGNHSNFNDDFYTVKRAASDGALLWTHRYGAPCVGCYDVPGDVIVDAAGHVYVAGSTSSPPYSSDAIVFVLDAATGAETDRGVVAAATPESASWQELRLDPSGNVLLGGRFSNANTGAKDIAIAKYAAPGGPPPPPSCGVSLSGRCGSPRLTR
jgi:hypothetical protein